MSVLRRKRKRERRRRRRKRRKENKWINDRRRNAEQKMRIRG